MLPGGRVLAVLEGIGIIMPDRETIIEDAEFAGVLQEIAVDEVEIARARSRVYALCSHYSDLADGENYEVDIDAGIFRGLMDGVVTCAGPLQVLGTYHGDEFMFAWHNESIVPEAYKEVQEYCLGEAVLAPLLAKGKFLCSPAGAEKLAQWVAYKMGFHGAFEAPNASALAFLLLKLSPCEAGAGVDVEDAATESVAQDGHFAVDAEPSDACDDFSDLWCSFCGGTASCVSQLFQASPSCSICNVCVRQLVDILHEEEETGNLSEETAPFMVPCLICGDKLPRIFTTHGAVCYSCLRIPAFQAAV